MGIRTLHHWEWYSQSSKGQDTLLPHHLITKGVYKMKPSTEKTESVSQSAKYYLLLNTPNTIHFPTCQISRISSSDIYK